MKRDYQITLDLTKNEFFEICENAGIKNAKEIDEAGRCLPTNKDRQLVKWARDCLLGRIGE